MHDWHTCPTPSNHLHALGHAPPQGKVADEDDDTVVNRGKRRRAWEEEEEANLDEIARKEAEQMLKGGLDV